LALPTFKVRHRLSDAPVVGADFSHFLRQCALLFAYLIERRFDIPKLKLSPQVLHLF
jgi:hypothetical protein